MTNRTSASAAHRWLLPLLVAALLAPRAALLFALPDSLAADPDGYRLLADNLREQSVFGFGDRPTAYRPPLYPLLFAATLTGTDRPELRIALVHFLLGAATIGLTWHLGVRWHLPWPAPPIAAALVAYDPILLNQSALVMTETLATFWAVLTLVALSRALETLSPRDAVLAGGCLGLAALTRPTFLPWLALLPLAFWAVRAPRLRTSSCFAWLAAATLLVLSPWMLRNLAHFGRPLATTTHGGYTLLLANNPSYYRHLRQAPWGTVWDPAEFHAQLEAQRLPIESPADELVRDRELASQAWSHIRQQPGMFVWSCLVRLGNLFSPLPHRVDPAESPLRTGLRYMVAMWYLAQFALAAYGLAALGARLRQPALLGGITLLITFAAAHAFYWSNLRMRAPLVPVIALFAAVGWGALALQATRRKLLSNKHFDTPPGG